MFKDPFSFDGRIRRTEYGFSVIIYAIVISIVRVISESGNRSNDTGSAVIAVILMIPSLWFLWAQGAKRCHDLGNSGWLQLIPFYGLWLLFQDGEPGTNVYGDNPKSVQINNQTIQNNQGTGSYQSNLYNGGHNNPNNINSPPTSQNTPNGGEYQSGSFYN